MIGKKSSVVVMIYFSLFNAAEESQNCKYHVSKTNISANQILYEQQISETEVMQAGRIKTQVTQTYFAFIQTIKPSEPKTIIIKKPESIFIWLERSYECQEKNIAENKQSSSP